MKKKLLYYVVLLTGLTVALVGLISFFSTYGDTTFAGIWGQITGVICVLGGLINLLVAVKIKNDLHPKENSSHSDTETADP